MPKIRSPSAARLTLKWLAALLLAPPLLAVLFILIFGWNWARGPLQRYVTEKTGRELVIGGDLGVSLAWPAPRVRARAVTFANPPWAREKQMIAVDDAEFSIDLLELLRKNLTFPEVRLTRPVVFLELAADGRKTWLLDHEQQDEDARIPIGRLTLDRGQLGYDDAKQKTSIRSDISTQDASSGKEAKAGNPPEPKPGEAGTAGSGVVFSAKGTYKGLAVAAHGSGGSVLRLHDDSEPYPLKVELSAGHTLVKADGTITSLIKFTAMDMHLALRGDSLAQLYPLFNVAFPETHPYTTAGHIVHSAQTWRYEKFSGRVGKSDIAGTLQFDYGGKRPFMHGELASQLLEFDDLGPLIGATPVHAPAARASAPAGAAPVAAAASNPAPTPAPVPVSVPVAVAGTRMLPEIPFKTERWSSVDADVKLRAKTIARAKQLPLENLVAHLKMKDSVLTLDPLDFGFAGGHLKSVISLDGQHSPIRARVRLAARKLHLAKLFPTVKLNQASIGEINGYLELEGKGNSVGRMLAGSDGKVGLLAANGEISRLMMEASGLHLLEILELKLSGDQIIKLNCAVADFRVKNGIMQANALVVDTDVNTIAGRGSIDLGHETLDLTLQPRTKRLSLIALRSPIHVTGPFSKPNLAIDKGKVLARGGAALLLGFINPLLALAPLVETGKDVDSHCHELIQAAKAPLESAARATGSAPVK